MDSAAPRLGPFRVTPCFSGKIWGSEDLNPWFPSTSGKIGEVWYTDAANGTSLKGHVVGGGKGGALLLGEAVRIYGEQLLGTAVAPDSFPLLVKLLFPTEKLSVQVHPGDAWAAAHENSRGKTEMWHVLRAEPGACVAAGFRHRHTAEEVKHAALDGSIEEMLQWWPVQQGDTIYIPAGTVHAIGPGLVLCEIQQSSDITYRLYDYGRPRPLHLEQSLAVATLGPHPGLSRAEWLGHGRTLLAEGEYFRTERVELGAGSSLEIRPNSRRFEVWIAVDGEGSWGEEVVRPGAVVVLPASGVSTRLRAARKLTLLRTFPPV